MNRRLFLPVFVCATLTPALTNAGGLFGDLKERLKEQVNQVKEQVIQTKEQTQETLGQTLEESTDISRLFEAAAEPSATANGSVVNEKNSPTPTSPPRLKNSEPSKTPISESTTTKTAKMMSATTVDIVGLTLGMSPQIIKSTLQARDPKVQVRDNNLQLHKVNNSRYLAGVIASSASGDQIAVEFSAPPNDSVSTKIVRTSQYRDGAQPTAAKTIDALKQKYGQPTHEEKLPRGQQLVWLYDSAGKKLERASKPTVQLCTAVATNHAEAAQYRDDLATCGPSLNAILLIAEPSGLVTQFNTILLNSGVEADMALATLAHQERSQQLQIEAVAAPEL